MQDMEQTTPDMRVLTDAELEAVDGGSFFGKVVHFLHDVFAGPGDHRRSTDRPN